MTAVSGSTSRPRLHDRSTDSEKQILAAAERVLAKVSARDVSVAQIIAEAGVARGTFYHYFSSKWDVINTLVVRVMGTIFERTETMFLKVDEATSPQQGLRTAIDQSVEIWAEHRAVLRAIFENWREVPELGAMWSAATTQFRDSVASELDGERAAGLAPDGPDSRQLVAALIRASERCLYIAGLDDVDDFADEAAAAEVMKVMWVQTLYAPRVD